MSNRTKIPGQLPFDFSAVRPYGDTLDDGVIQLSFTLPVPPGDRATEAAKRLLKKIGFHDPVIVSESDIGEGFTYFIAYGRTGVSVDYNAIQVVSVKTEERTMEEIDALINERFGRKLVVVGACTGDDAHTVGIDAILNMKGVDHHYGLERYTGFAVRNCGSQVKNEELVAIARKLKADAVLISQLVTQKESHIHNLTNFIELAEAEGLRETALLIIGGPRISHELARELGFDAGFGKKTWPEDVASFIVDKLWERMVQE